MAYQQPMVTVDQNLTITPTSIERDQPAFIFGPNYELHRYSEDSEKPGTYAGTYSGAEKNIKYPNVIDVDNVDKSYTKLIGDNVIAELADLGTATLPETGSSVADKLIQINGGYSRLFFPGKRFVTRSVEGVKGDLTNVSQDIEVGDSLVVSYEYDGSSSSEEKVNILTKVTAIAYSKNGFDIDSDVEGGDSGTETGEGTLITIEDVIPVAADTSNVSAKLVAVEDGVEFDRKDDVTPGEYQWEQPADKIEEDDDKFYGIQVNELYAYIPGYDKDKKYYKVLSADLYVTYRELVTSYADTIHSITSNSQVSNVLGKISPDNPLAMGVYMATLNSATDDGDEAPPVYFMATPSDDLDGYDSVLNKASLTDRVYVMAPTTRDETVLEKVRSHCLEMSAKTVKKWRIAFVSAEIPATVDRLNAKFDPQGDDFLAIPLRENGSPTPNAEGKDAKFSYLRIVKSNDDIQGNQDTALLSTVVKGDKVRFNFRKNEWREDVWDTYTVRRVINNFTLEVYLDDRDNDGTEDGIDVKGMTESGDHYTAVKLEIYHTYTAAETAEEVASISKSFASRRMYNVFPSVFGNDGKTLTGEFAACAVAGLVSATEPQQPITNMTVRGIDDIPMIYQTFNRDQLNVMAGGGTFIIAQDMPNDLVYIRHQISTAYPDGNLNTAELSITKNVDSISYAFAEVFRPYYGKYNITPDLLATLDNRTKNLISEFARSSSVYGPQLIADETELLYVRQNELMKDHADICVRIGVPYPCNNIDIVLTV